MPVPALLILGLMAKSMTLLTGTRMLSLVDISARVVFSSF
jgi:hypothetical protein